MYLKSAGGCFALLCIMFAFGINMASTSYSSWWLKSWFKSATPVDTYQETILSNSSTVEYYSSTISYTEIPFENRLDDEFIPISGEIISINSPDFVFNRNVYAGIIGAIFVTSLLRTVLFTFVSVFNRYSHYCCFYVLIFVKKSADFNQS